jgi:NAD(P)H-dependent nitrite reductase small subunit
MQDASRGVYKRIILRDKKIIGAVLYGDTIDGPWYFQHLRDGTDVSQMRERLVFGAANLGDGGHSGKNSVAAMSDDAEICGCNGVCKGTIVKAISEKKLFTIDDVRAHTKASSSCGSCTGLVEQVLAFTLGGDYSAAPKVKPMCACTDHSHDDARRVIIENGLKTIPDVMRFMDWKTPNGCHSCRPALNYYLLATWPGEYRDDQQSRYINERVHANIQKDGTYSVVPRMWGGVTTPDELRAIADVADKFKIPTVKVTGGQRIDLLGVKKEDLPAVWADLNDAGMVSGHAYAKGLRTVKTCVGSEWCRFGTQDSTGLGIKIEKFMWGSWTPAKVKLAVSGCPRNCAEGHLQGCRRGLRRFRLRDPFRRRRRSSHQGNRVPRQGRDRGGDARSHRRADAALSRAGLVPGAHVQVVRSGRPRCHPQAGGRRCRQPQSPVQPLRLFAAILAKRSLGGARQTRRRSQRIHPARGAGTRMSNWIEIGTLNDIPVLGSRVVRTASGDIAVFRTADDEVFALDDRCPHKGGPLSQGIVHNKRVTCPLHNFVIELKSGAAVAPDEGCTRAHPTKVENDIVWLCVQTAAAVPAE